MKRVVETGCTGTARFSIVGDDTDDDTEYNATVVTQNKQYKTKFSCWEAARKWVDNKIIDIEEMGHEAGRDY